MSARNLAELPTLDALWGGAFLFIRLGAADFGPVALSAVRVAPAALVLAPLLSLHHLWPALRRPRRVTDFRGKPETTRGCSLSVQPLRN